MARSSYMYIRIPYPDCKSRNFFSDFHQYLHAQLLKYSSNTDGVKPWIGPTEMLIKSSFVLFFVTSVLPGKGFLHSQAQLFLN